MLSLEEWEEGYNIFCRVLHNFVANDDEKLDGHPILDMQEWFNKNKPKLKTEQYK